ncbi:hypothetical protein LDE71_19660, partial [Mycobacterium tuberculosis]
NGGIGGGATGTLTFFGSGGDGGPGGAGANTAGT